MEETVYLLGTISSRSTIYERLSWNNIKESKSKHYGWMYWTNIIASVRQWSSVSQKNILGLLSWTKTWLVWVFSGISWQWETLRKYIIVLHLGTLVRMYLSLLCPLCLLLFLIFLLQDKNVWSSHKKVTAITHFHGVDQVNFINACSNRKPTLYSSTCSFHLVNVLGIAGIGI